jgi:transmembrane sensor
MKGTNDGAPTNGSSRWIEAAYWVDTLKQSSDVDVAHVKLHSFAKWTRDALNIQTYDQVFRLVWDRKRYRRRPVPTTEELQKDTYDPCVSVEEWLSQQKAVEGGLRRSRFLVIVTAVAAAVLVVVAVPVLISRTAHERPNSEWAQAYETSLGTSRNFILPDGSVTTAAGLTRFSVRYTEGYRTILVDQGEVLFQVKHNLSRPFRVFAGPARITAVGTTFDVRRDAERTSVAVTEGTVDVRPTAQSESHGDVSFTKRADAVLWTPVLLQRGQRISYEDDGRVSPVEHADPADTTAWRDGQLRFEHERLRSVVQAVNRYSRVPIVIDDPAAEDYLYSGTVMQSQTDEWILGLERIFPVRITKGADERVHIVSR